jgi:Tfp pilus assembly protein FimT
MKYQQVGATLLELLIALCLFSIGMMGVLALGVGLIKSHMISKQRTIAIQLAQNKMEALFSTEYSDVVDGIEEALNSTEALGAGIFHREVNVFEFSDPSYKNVTVSVTWDSAGKHHETLHSSIAAP